MWHCASLNSKGANPFCSVEPQLILITNALQDERVKCGFVIKRELAGTYATTNHAKGQVCKLVHSQYALMVDTKTLCCTCVTSIAVTRVHMNNTAR